MRAVLPEVEDPANGPVLGEVPDPEPEEGEVLVEVHGTALNHADLLQLKGLYPPPEGESRVPGLECAGVVAELGSGVGSWHVGDRVMALLAGGGHGTKVVAPEAQLMPIPEGWSFLEAGSLPEAALTAWTNLVEEGGLEAGETVVITGATGGVGSFAIQLARELGARVVAAGRDLGRLERLRELGAEAWVTLGEDFSRQVRDETEGRGADLVLDLVGGEHLPRVLESLADRGRVVLLGLLAGRRAEIDLGTLLRRRLRLKGSVLRSRSREEKGELVQAFHTFAERRLRQGRLRPMVDRVFEFEDIASAYEALAEGGAVGKVAVRVRPD